MYSPLTFLCRSIGVPASEYNATSRFSPFLSITVAANTQFRLSWAWKYLFLIHASFLFGCLRLAQRQSLTNTLWSMRVNAALATTGW
ncbi:hypothetical protein D9M70_555670 [compost metagenome]